MPPGNQSLDADRIFLFKMKSKSSLPSYWRNNNNNNNNNNSRPANNCIRSPLAAWPTPSRHQMWNFRMFPTVEHYAHLKCPFGFCPTSKYYKITTSRKTDSTSIIRWRGKAENPQMLGPGNWQIRPPHYAFALFTPCQERTCLWTLARAQSGPVNSHLILMNCSYFQPDYDDIEEENRVKPFPSSRGRDKAKDSKKYGEYLILRYPYYKLNCIMSGHHRMALNSLTITEGGSNLPRNCLCFSWTTKQIYVTSARPLHGMRQVCTRCDFRFSMWGIWR
jgi:hypothetical protein